MSHGMGDAINHYMVYGMGGAINHYMGDSPPPVPSSQRAQPERTPACPLCAAACPLCAAACPVLCRLAHAAAPCALARMRMSGTPVRAQEAMEALGLHAHGSARAGPCKDTDTRSLST